MRCSATIIEAMRQAQTVKPDAKPDRITRVMAAIDLANGEDPNKLVIDGEERPAELVYGERMSEALDGFCPDASEELAIAARGQHIRRWTSKRSDYPEGRIGYLKWRADLKCFHAETIAGIMVTCGYDEQAIQRVGSLVRKNRLKQDPDAQALEDVVCLVFLAHYFEAFAAKHSDDKVIKIVRKTWRKMSECGHEAALALDLPTETGRLVSAALATSD